MSVGPPPNEVLYSKNALVPTTVKMCCLECKQTMVARIDMPPHYPEDSEIVLNVSWCPFDTEEGRKALYKGLSITAPPGGG